MATTPTAVVSGARPAFAPDLAQLRFGDMLALGGAALYFLTKFSPFFLISITGAQQFAREYNGWEGSRDILNVFEILAVVAVIGVFVVGPLLSLVPGVRGSIGLIYAGCGAVLLLLTLIAFLDVRNEYQQTNFLVGAPAFGFFLGLLLALVVGLAGLMKMRMIPGDGLVSLASPAPASTVIGGGGQPFAIERAAPGAQFPAQQPPPQFPQGDGTSTPGRPAAPPNASGGYAPPAAPRNGPGAPPPGGYSGSPPGQGGPPGADGRSVPPR